MKTNRTSSRSNGNGGDKPENPKWKIRVAIMGLVIGLMPAGFLIISALAPANLQDYLRLSWGIVIVIAVLMIALFLLRTILRLEAQNIVQEVLEGVFTYRFDPKRGGFYYGNVRNVVTRVLTFQEIVKSAMKGLSKPKRDQKLFKMGYQIGGSFAQTMKETVLPKERIRTDVLTEDLLNLRDKYDYRAGFANFDFGDFDPLTEVGKIQINGHVLNYQRENESLILCSFFHGYVDAMLASFSEHKFNIRSNCLKGPHSVCNLQIIQRA